jgi:hypothetical protein
MRPYLIPIAVLAAALVVFVGLVQPPPVLKHTSDTTASQNVRDLKKDMSLLTGDPGNARR